MSFDSYGPFSLELDGFNKDLNVGYEYITSVHRSSFTQEAILELNKAIESNDNGPYIKFIGALSFYDDTDKSAFLEELDIIIQDFITDLRAKGVV